MPTAPTASANCGCCAPVFPASWPTSCIAGPPSRARCWQALLDGGLEPYGLDALDILRVEKGLPVSSEINGETTPYDLGLDRLVRAGNPCLGRELLERPAFHERSRPRLVGLRALDGRSQFLGGAQLTRPRKRTQPCGHVTSSVYSPALGEWLGLALVRALDRAGHGAHRRAIRCAAATRTFAWYRPCTSIRTDRA